jgi:hypothetical protein
VGEGTVERGRFGKWGENFFDKSEMLSFRPRFQCFFLIFFFFNKKKKRKKMCHMGQEPDSSRTLDARIALLGLIRMIRCRGNACWRTLIRPPAPIYNKKQFFY